LEALDPGLGARILARIERLASDPRLQARRSTQQLWRIRVGDYRVVYGLDVVVAAAHYTYET
jgi:mRNA-degrading endonuclease RelE of RelBE toxin-antitoxin system